MRTAAAFAQKLPPSAVKVKVIVPKEPEPLSTALVKPFPLQGDEGARPMSRNDPLIRDGDDRLELPGNVGQNEHIANGTRNLLRPAR